MTDAAEFQVLDSSLGDDGWSFAVRVPETSRYFEGHFADRPVLPAIAQLALLESLHRLAVDAPVRLRRIDVLRLLRPVGPGELLSVRLDPPDEQRCGSFTIRSSGDVVSRGTLTWTTPGES